MASTPTDLRPPWALPGRWAPLTIGMVLALVIAAAALAAQAVGAPIQYVRLPFEVRVPWMFAGSTIWLYWMVATHVRGVQRDFDALRPSLEAPEADLDHERRRLARPRPALAWGAVALALVASAVVQEFNTARWTRFASGDWNAFDVVAALTAMGFILLVFQSYALVISSSLELRRIGGELLDLRPFDATSFEPFTRAGLRTVLLVVAMPMVVFSVLFAWIGGSPATFLGFFGLNLVLALLYLSLPTHALVSRLRRWRAQELTRVGRAIEGDRAALAASPFARELESLDLPGLLAYRREVENVRTNPFRLENVLRFVLYVVLPPLSWVAAALVERLVDAAVG